MTIQQTQDQVVHHAANFAAVTIPTMSAMLGGPQVLTVVTAILGIIWYCILIGEKIVGMVRKYRGRSGDKP